MPRTRAPLLFLLMLAVLLTACSDPAAKGPPAAPDFTLSTPRGKEVSLAQYRGLPVVINFFTTWCGPCRNEMPGIQRTYHKYAGDGLVVIGVNVEETASEVSGYVKELGLTFPIVMDPSGKIANSYQVNAFPRTVFVHPNGTIYQTVRGSMSESEFGSYVDALMALPRQPTITPTSLVRVIDAEGQAIEGCVAIKMIYVRTAPSKNADAPFTYVRDTCLAFDARSPDGKWLRLAEQATHEGSRLWAAAGSIDLKGNFDSLPVME